MRRTGGPDETRVAQGRYMVEIANEPRGTNFMIAFEAFMGYMVSFYKGQIEEDLPARRKWYQRSVEQLALL